MKLFKKEDINEMKIFKYLKWKIRAFCLYLENKSRNLIIPEDLWNRISTNNKNIEELNKLYSEISNLRKIYPEEPELIRAQAIIERMKILGR